MSEAVRSQRLGFKPVEAGDTDTLESLLSRPAVGRFVVRPPQRARSMAECWVAESQDPASLTRLWLLSIHGGPMIGIAGLMPPSTASLRLRNIGWRSLEVLVALHPGFWGSGYAHDAVEAMAEYASADPVTFALVAPVDEADEPSHALFRRCGFLVLGRTEEGSRSLVIYERSL